MEVNHRSAGGQVHEFKPDLLPKAGLFRFQHIKLGNSTDNVTPLMRQSNVHPC